MRLFLETVSGNEVRSDVLTLDDGSTPTEEQYEEFRKAIYATFEEFSKLSYISLYVGGVKRYYNPGNIVSACVR